MCTSLSHYSSIPVIYYAQTARLKHKQRTVLWDLSDNYVADLKNGLVKVVDNVLEDHPSYKMLGRSFVCPTSVIDKICTEARYINSIDDLNIIGVRPEIKNALYCVVCSVVSQAPYRKKSRHV